MNAQELKEFAEERLKEMEPEVVAETFMKMYLAGKINIDTLAFLVDVCGFELDEKFRTATREEQEKMLEDAKNKGEELTEEILEDEEDEEDDDEEEELDIYEDEEEEKGEEDDRASRSEDYDGEKVYDKKGNPAQREAEGENGGEDEQKQAEKLYNLKF